MPELVMSERWTGPNAAIPDALGGEPTEHADARRRREDHRARVRAGAAPRRPKRGDGWTVKATDEALLRALTRYGVMTHRQASTAFYNGVEKTSLRRIGYLREAGLLHQSRDDEWAGRVLVGNSPGHTLVAGDLSVPLSPVRRHPGERLLHALATTDLGLRFEARGDHVLTEREIRTLEATPTLAAQHAASLGVPVRSAQDARGIDRWFCAPVGSGFNSDARVHYPDLVVVTNEGLIAVEVEVTVKPVARLREIVRGYRDSQIFKQVIYFTTGQVGALLHGYREPDGERCWIDGVLQQVSVLPKGLPPTYGPDTLVHVQQVAPRDPGVGYRIDMRQVPESWKIDRSEWRELRSAWEADTKVGKAAKVPFLRWWLDVEVPRRKAALRTA